MNTVPAFLRMPAPRRASPSRRAGGLGATMSWQPIAASQVPLSAQTAIRPWSGFAMAAPPTAGNQKAYGPVQVPGLGLVAAVVTAFGSPAGGVARSFQWYRWTTTPSFPLPPFPRFRGPLGSCGGDCSEPILDPAVVAAKQWQLSQYTCPRCGPTCGCNPFSNPAVAQAAVLAGPRSTSMNVVPSFLRLPPQRRFGRMRGLGAVQNFTIAPGPLNISASLGDTITLNLPIGNSGVVESSWVLSSPVILPAQMGAISGGTPGGADPVTIANLAAGGNGTLSWIDATGTNQQTQVTVTIAAVNPPNNQTVTCADGSVHPAGYVCPAAPASGTTTGTSTGTIVAIGIAAVAAGGILAYALANRSHTAAVPARAPAARRLPARRSPARRRR